MTLEQIATMLNERVVPAIMGDSFTLSPDLSNIIDFGTVISSMTASQFKDYMDAFVAGIARTITDDREYSPEKLPFYINEQEYGGAVQSIKADMFTVQDSHLYSLVDGQTYNDVNKFFGTDTTMSADYTRKNVNTYKIDNPNVIFATKDKAEYGEKICFALCFRHV